jgi:hypothetical protein
VQCFGNHTYSGGLHFSGLLHSVGVWLDPIVLGQHMGTIASAHSVQ